MHEISALGYIFRVEIAKQFSADRKIPIENSKRCSKSQVGHRNIHSEPW